MTEDQVPIDLRFHVAPKSDPKEYSRYRALEPGVQAAAKRARRQRRRPLECAWNQGL
jgi:hypothetical protein